MTESEMQTELEKAYASIGALSPPFIQRKFRFGYKTSKEIADKFMKGKRDEIFREMMRRCPMMK